ncbi:MAG: enoyl-CoA hydratase-related protein [Bacteroidetes bacterium]|nr:enoyl-CoA hydratase-related protein [Bacteroidota bacterium]MDA1120284.1 enoyl-CoA hydratase-related protein [Bacteroidota bacterium]
MIYQNLLVDTDDNGIQTITINRPDKLNALSLETLKELKDAVHQVYDDETIKGVIITGSGEKAFVAGADITEFSEINELNARKFAENGQETFKLIEDCHTPIIAAVNGFALGGGCELTLACHMRLATANAKFGQPEVNLGIIPGYGGTQRLTRIIGSGKAFELMATGNTISADEAEEYGLVNYVCESKDALLAKCEEILLTIGKKAPHAVGQVIDCINAVSDPEKNGFQIEANAFANCCGTEDFIEGRTAFIEKRAPNFTGK